LSRDFQIQIRIREVIRSLHAVLLTPHAQ
jgi:hypothetical protein